jgi:hypothetical protein
LARAGLALAALLAACALAVPSARADGDPASDVLLFQKVYLPYAATLPPASVTALKRIVAQANRQGYTVRVALIAGRTDLGSWPTFFDKPQKYASFLSQELFLVPGGAYKNRVLTVMPGGYGLSVNGKTLPRENRALAGMKTPTAAGDDLATSAVRAVQQLAAVKGVKLEASLPASKGGSATWPLLLGGILTLIVVTSGIETFRRVRRR